jgi:hypothetical protein
VTTMRKRTAERLVAGEKVLRAPEEAKVEKGPERNFGAHGSTPYVTLRQKRLRKGQLVWAYPADYKGNTYLHPLFSCKEVNTLLHEMHPDEFEGAEESRMKVYLMEQVKVTGGSYC